MVRVQPTTLPDRTGEGSRTANPKRHCAIVAPPAHDNNLYYRNLWRNAKFSGPLSAYGRQDSPSNEAFVRWHACVHSSRAATIVKSWVENLQSVGVVPLPSETRGAADKIPIPLPSVSERSRRCLPANFNRCREIRRLDEIPVDFEIIHSYAGGRTGLECRSGRQLTVQLASFPPQTVERCRRRRRHTGTVAMEIGTPGARGARMRGLPRASTDRQGLFQRIRVNERIVSHRPARRLTAGENGYGKHE